MMTALMKAAGNGHIEVVRFLLESDADREIKNQQNQTAIMFAAAGGHLEVVRFLVDWSDICFDACEQEMMERGDTQFDIGREGCRRQCGQSGLYATSLGMSWDALIHGPIIPIHWAAYHGHLDVVEYLHDTIMRGSVDAKSAYLMAVLGGHMDIVNFYLDVDYRAEFGRILKPLAGSSRALMYAAYMNHTDIVSRLLETGSSVTWRMSDWIGISTPEGRLYFERIGFGPPHASHPEWRQGVPEIDPGALDEDSRGRWSR